MTLIKDLKPYKTSWRVTLKLVHSWKQNTSFGGESLECVLADESGDKIHATCKRSQMFRVQRCLPVGEWRVLENFSISQAGGQYRPTKLQYKMTILGNTVISRTNFHDDNHFLDLANYEDISNGKLNDHFLIDVIGHITDLGGVTTVQVKEKERKRVQFRLRDTSGYEVACCLWGKYAQQIESYMEEATDESIICLIRFAKISFYKGEVQITNAFDASLVLLNPTMEEAIDFKNKILHDALPLALLDKSNEKKIIKNKKVADDWNDVDVRCISEVLNAMEAENCKIVCTIQSIDTDWGWFYFGCNRHNRRVTKIGVNSSGKMLQSEKPLFRCDVCHANVSNVSPKYKLHLFVKDDSESCKLMLLDSVAKTIIGNTAVELWDGSYEEIEDPEILPMPIQNLVGKSFCFGLQVTSDNVTNGSHTFKVSEVWSGDHIQRIESLSEPVSQIETISSTLSGGEILPNDYNKENSSEGFSTPSTKRKEEDTDFMDMASTSKKLCNKIIKMEKKMSE